MPCKIKSVFARLFGKKECNCKLASLQDNDSIMFYRAQERKKCIAAMARRRAKEARERKESNDKLVIAWILQTVNDADAHTPAAQEKREKLGLLLELFPKESGEVEEKFERRIQLMSEITSKSIPEVEWTRYECVAWVYHCLVDLLQNSHDCAAGKARGFSESGLWLLQMDRLEWEHVIGRNGGGASLFARVKDIKEQRARLGETLPPSYASHFGGMVEHGQEEDRLDLCLVLTTEAMNGDGNDTWMPKKHRPRHRLSLRLRNKNQQKRHIAWEG